MEVAVVGLDVGFGNVKLYSAKGGRKFPTLISPAKGEALGEAEVIRLPSGEEYEIGVLTGAVETRDSRFPLKPEYKAIVYYALRNYGGKRVALGLGSPINWDYRGELERIFKGKHVFYYNDKEVVLEIIPFPFLQGWGGYIDSIYTLDGKYLEKEDVPALFVDVGYYTIDLLITEQVFQGGTFKIRPKRIPGGTLGVGTSKFYETLMFQLEKRGERVPSVKLIEFVEEGVARNPWDKDKYEEARNVALNLYLSEVRAELEKILSEYEKFIEKIHVFGGGAKLVEPVLKNFGKPFSVGDEYSNARGFYKATKAKLIKRR